MPSLDSFNTLEERLKRIELKMYGNGQQYGNHPEVVSTLSDLSTKMDGILASRDRMMAVMKRSEELDGYLDPSYGTSSSQLTDAEMTDLLLAQTDYWEQQYEALTKYNSLKSVLESKPIADAADLSGKFAEVSLKQSELEQLSQEQGLEVASFVGSYNQMLKAVSESLLSFEERLTKLEIAALPKKVKD